MYKDAAMPLTEAEFDLILRQKQILYSDSAWMTRAGGA